MDEGGPAALHAPREGLLFLALRVTAAMCFIGHGAFGIITKEAWLPYFAVVGIGPHLGYALMPVIGASDILLGISMLVYPTRAALAYMTVWALWTALLRPLAGQGVPEFLERAGNYGVPAALLLLGLAKPRSAGWFSRLSSRPFGAGDARRVGWLLRLTTATLLLGHGILALAGKPEIARHLAAIGLGSWGSGGGSALGVAAGQGALELMLAAAVLVFPAWPLRLLALAWKIGTELLFPLTGDYVWEFVERGGSYGAPLALLILGRMRDIAGL